MSVAGVLDTEAQIIALTRVAEKLRQYVTTKRTDANESPAAVATDNPRIKMASDFVQSAIKVLGLTDEAFGETFGLPSSSPETPAVDLGSGEVPLFIGGTPPGFETEEPTDFERAEAAGETPEYFS